MTDPTPEPLPDGLAEALADARAHPEQLVRHPRPDQLLEEDPDAIDR